MIFEGVDSSNWNWETRDVSWGTRWWEMGDGRKKFREMGEERVGDGRRYTYTPVHPLILMKRP